MTNKIVTKKLATKKPAKPPAATAAPPSLARRPAGYPEWLADVKDRVRVAQQRASLSVNRELLRLYWGIGRDILDRQVAGTWGEGIVDHVAADLRAEFPSMKGFSRSNLMYMRAFAEAWPDPAFVQQPVGQIPWGHNLVLLTKLKDKNARIAYATSVLKHGWSRAVLVHHIEARTEVRVSSTTMFGIPHLPSRGFTYRCLLCGLAVFGVVSVACTEATRISAPLDARMDLIGNTDRQDALIFAADSNDSGPNPCGNGLQDPGEECDDGNARDGDGCRNCSLELGSICPHFGQPCMKIYACGNGYLSSDEACDDGNTVSGDGCSGDCHQVEPGWQCRVPAKACTVTCDSVPSACTDGGSSAECGNGIVQPGEECDDGNDPTKMPHNDDSTYGGCTTKCKHGPYCGDGVINGAEVCDDGPNYVDIYGQPGCSFLCTKASYCGDDILDPQYGEECDLGAANGGPDCRCSSRCQTIQCFP